MDLTLTKEPVCPHCGHRHRDAWEWSLQNGEPTNRECYSCDMEFECTRVVDVSYTTKKTEGVE